jgi:membrane protease YdiL (CAAX protease family)
MWALRHPAAMAAVPFSAGWREARILVMTCAAGSALAAAGMFSPEMTAIVGVAAIHGGLVAAALVWSGVPVGEAVVVIVLLVLARGVATLHPLGALGYLAVPLWLGRLALAGRLTRLGLGRPWPWGPVGVGALAGLTLALHLVTCASRTLGYTIRIDGGVVVPALGYDLGANVVSAELFFRGAVLHHLWRRWTFGLALAVASLAAAVRYCVDPFAATTELRVGAAVYMTMLAILNGVLCRWSGSLLPGLVAAAIFFACYRLLATG